MNVCSNLPIYRSKFLSQQFNTEQTDSIYLKYELLSKQTHLKYIYSEKLSRILGYFKILLRLFAHFWDTQVGHN